MQQKLNVPVINIAPLVVPGSNAKDIQDTVDAIGKACAEWGFFYILDHQIDTKLIDEFQRRTREFFQKPTEFKKSVGRTQDNFRGFSNTELTKLKQDWKEIFDYGAELIKKENRVSEVDGENQWPKDMPEFKSVLLSYFEEIHYVSKKLTDAIFSSLGVDPSRFEKDFEASKDTSFVRMNYYPICSDTSSNLGVGPHADSGFLTVLWQDMDVTSLQVEKDGVFYDVYPIPNSYVINIGEMAQVWSNNLYMAPIHRVLANPGKVRYSAPFFYNPSYHCDIAPIETCISEKNPCLYRPINWAEFRKGRFQSDYANVGEEIKIKHYLI